MPADWFTPTIEAITKVLWPAVVIALAILFRVQLRRILNELQEFTVPGASAKVGNKRAEDLAREAGALGDEEEPEAPTPRAESAEGDEGPEVGSMIVTEDATVDAGTLETTTPSDGAVHTERNEGVEFLRFARNLLLLKLRGRMDNTGTTSKRLSAEIVSSAYSDVLLAVRVVAYWVGGPATVSGKRGRKIASDVTLRTIGAPDSIVDLVVGLRDVNMDIRTGEDAVDGSGAADFVVSARQTTERLFDWAIGQLDTNN